MKGYINLELGGVKRGIKFGNRALLDIMAKHQVSEGIKFSFDLVVDLVYYGMVNNCANAKANVDFTPDEVEEWVDNLPMPKLMDIFNVFTDSYSDGTTPGPVKKISKTSAVKKQS